MYKFLSVVFYDLFPIELQGLLDDIEWVPVVFEQPFALHLPRLLEASNSFQRLIFAKGESGG
jgi:hypothetical protein